MKTIQLEHDGVTFIVPEGFQFIDLPIAQYPNFCGAGSGIREKLIPDQWFGVRFSIACHVHDEMWSIRPKSWLTYHASNSIFARNMFVIIDQYMNVLDPRRHQKLMNIINVYMNSVSSPIGAAVYWRS
jgi:hypothetical protein